MKKNDREKLESAIKWIQGTHPNLSASAVDDLTQDAWLYFLENKTRKYPFTNVRNYLSHRVLFYLPKDVSLEGNNLGYAIDSVDPYKIMQWREKANVLYEAIRGELSSRQSDIILLRFGFFTGQSFSETEIAEFYNVTRERVRQIISLSKSKLKKSGCIQDVQSLVEENLDFPIYSNENISKQVVDEYAHGKAQYSKQYREQKEERERLWREREARRIAYEEEIAKLEKLLGKSLSTPSPLSIIRHNCPIDVVTFFLAQDKNLPQGFYVVNALPANLPYIIASYGVKSGTLRLEAWDSASAPEHIKKIVLEPEYSKRFSFFQPLLNA